MKANAPRHCLDAKSSLTLALSQRQPPSTKPLAERPVFSNSNRVKLRHATGLTAGRASLTEDQLRAYFLFLRQEKHYGGSAMKLARCALRALFRDCLRLAADWTACIAPPQTLPLVLAREQVATRLSLPCGRQTCGSLTPNQRSPSAVRPPPGTPPASRFTV